MLPLCCNLKRPMAAAVPKKCNRLVDVATSSRDGCPHGMPQTKQSCATAHTYLRFAAGTRMRKCAKNDCCCCYCCCFMIVVVTVIVAAVCHGIFCEHCRCWTSVGATKGAVARSAMQQCAHIHQDTAVE